MVGTHGFGGGEALAETFGEVLDKWGGQGRHGEVPVR